MDLKIDQLKSYIEEQFCSRDKKTEEICGNLFEELREQIELQFTNELKKQSKRIEELEYDKTMPQNQILKIWKQRLQNQQEIEKLEQYGRRLFLRFKGTPTERNETSDKVLEKMMGIWKESAFEIADLVKDQAHRIDVPYVDKITKKSCKNVIFWFYTSHYQTIVHRAKKKHEKFRKS